MANILLVEDDAAIANAYTIVLERAGHRVNVAIDGADGLRQVRPDHNVIVLDMLMPGFSGLDFLKSYDAIHQRTHPAIICLSNIDTPSIVEQAKALGAEEYLLKVNLDPNQLADVIAEHLG